MDTPGTESPEMVGGIKKTVFFFSNEFPQGDHATLFRSLHQHAKDRRFRYLANFLEDSRDAVKRELLKLSQSEQDLVQPFDSILTLGSDPASHNGPLKAPIEAALLTSMQVGSVIGFYEGQNKSFNPRADHSAVAGLSIGLLAATAVTASHSLDDLVRIGSECVRIAFRLGHHVFGFSQSLDPRVEEGSPESWAYVVTGLTPEEIQKEVDEFNTKTQNEELTKIFISAADSRSINVTGPPGRLRDIFKQSQVLRHSKFFPLPVYEGLCHGGHLFTREDIASVVDSPNAKIEGRRTVQVPLLSSATGRPFAAHTISELLLEVARELMTCSVHLDCLKAGLLIHLSNPEVDQCEFVSCGECKVLKRLSGEIGAEATTVNITKTDVTLWSKIINEPRLPRTYKESKLAVVGMSTRMPGGADDNELFWQLMVDGRDTVQEVPADRFDLSTHYDPTGKKPNTTQTPFGNFIRAPGLFDPQFFNMSPREAEQTDPAQRLALITAYEALEMAGYVPNRTPSSNLKRVGTYYGQASDDWRELNASQNIGTYIVTGGVRAFGNGRINYFFNFSGPSMNVDTACSSGLAAVQMACSALWAGEADTVLAGGLNIITDPDNYCGLSLAHFLSKTGQCKVWDEGADGYCRSDGIGSVVIKRLEDAVADNDNILATILAGATNHSAEAISITHPHAGNQKSNYEQVMNAAGVDPLDVTYIELHGTGTQAGDFTESTSVTEVFAPNKPRRRANQPLLLGSVKSNIGHGEAAAGIASFIKVLLMYQKSHIPPHIGIKTRINPRIPQDLDLRNVSLNQTNTAWPRMEDKKRYAVVNSFGAHGGNTTMLLEDAPLKPRVGTDPRNTHAITVSARSKNSLKMNLEALQQYLEQHPETDLGDLGYTTTVRRIHHNLRFTTAVSSIAQLQKELGPAIENASSTKQVPSDEAQVIFTYTGQGSIYKGVSSQLFTSFPQYRKQILTLDYIVRSYGFPSVIPLIDGSSEDDKSPLLTQLAILVVEIALTNVWSLLGITPQAVIGHSLGEYAALVAAGIISAADAIQLVGKRALLLGDHCERGTHLMLSVRGSVENIATACGGRTDYEVSCVNGKSDIVISGERNIMSDIRNQLDNAGLKCMELNLPYAFHTAQMEPMLDAYEKLAENVTFHAPKVPVISPLLKTCVFDAKSISAKYLRRASREPVDFVGAIEAAQQLAFVNDKTIWVDIGPHPISGSFVRTLIPDAKVLSSMNRKEDNFDTLTKALAALHTEGASVSWNEYYRPYEQAHDLLLLPKYKWNEKNYWIQYVGDWTLEKAFAKDKVSKSSSATRSALRTPFIHHVVSEEFKDAGANMSIISDLLHPDFKQALDGHKMNGYGVAATCIWMDVALTIGDHVYKKSNNFTGEVKMNLIGMEVHHPQVALSHTQQQLVQYEVGYTKDNQTMTFRMYNVDENGARSQDFFGSASVRFEDTTPWETEWQRVAHMVNGRIEALQEMAATGKADRLQKGMAYTLFKNCVDYAPEFHGMKNVVLNGLEAYADVELVNESTHNSHSPPHWIDSVVHLAGFICNGSDAVNNRDFFYVTPEMGSYRVAKRLNAQSKYQSYVRMFPTGEPNVYKGDVYILENGEIIGMTDQIKFTGFRRSLLDFFFSPADKSKKAGGAATKAAAPAPAAKPASAPVVAAKPAPAIEAPAAPKPAATAPAPAAAAPASAPPIATDGVFGKFLGMMAEEAGFEISEITDDRSIMELGVDSLMSLVLSERCRKELSVDIKSSVFIDCQTIGELRQYMEDLA